jgi:hypothetical protein
LEAAHLLYAVLCIRAWYPDVFPNVLVKVGDLESTIFSMVPQYHSAFSKKYAGRIDDS